MHILYLTNCTHAIFLRYDKPCCLATPLIQTAGLDYFQDGAMSLKNQLFSQKERKNAIGNQPLEPVNIKSSVTSRDNTALLCPVAAYVQTNGAGFPAGGRRGSIRPLQREKRR